MSIHVVIYPEEVHTPMYPSVDKQMIHDDLISGMLVPASDGRWRA